MLNKKDGEFLRIIASVSVVVAHCVNSWVVEFFKNRDLLSVNYFTTLFDQFTRFTVPLFLFLSGFGLALKFKDKALDWAEYYRFRIFKILAPFLLWSFITGFRHIDYFENMSWSENFLGSVGLASNFLFVRGFDYQYYFLIVIFQFYLLFPFVYKFGRSRFMLMAFLLLHMSLMSPMESFLAPFELSVPALHSNFILGHWFWCFVGIYSAWNGDMLLKTLSGLSVRKSIIWWLAVFAVLNFEFLINMHLGKRLGDIDHFNRWSVLLYCLVSFMVFLKLKPILERTVYDNPKYRFLFTHVAPYTFFVYLAHTHVLRGVDYFFYEVTILDLIHRLILVVGGSYLLAWFTQWVLEDFPRLRFYFGLPGRHVIRWNEIPGFDLSARSKGWMRRDLQNPNTAMEQSRKALDA